MILVIYKLFVIIVMLKKDRTLTLGSSVATVSDEGVE